MSDRILGGFGLMLALLFMWQATLIEESPFSDILGPTVFPIIIGAVLAASSIYFIAKPDPSPSWPESARLFEFAMAVAVMVLYAELLPVTGFVIATADPGEAMQVVSPLSGAHMDDLKRHLQTGIPVPNDAIAPPTGVVPWI